MANEYCVDCKKAITKYHTKRCKSCANRNRKGRFKRKSVFGEKSTNWKGDKVSYAGLHIWVKNNLGNPIKCEFCGKIETNRRKINWANKSHEYKRDLNDWFALCGFCHYKYDRGLR